MNRNKNVAHRAAMAWMFGMSTLAVAQNVDAQPRWGRPQAPRSGACFYRDFNFRGDYFCASAGEDIAYLSHGMNNEISSIRAFGDVEVTVYQDERFRGRSIRFTRDARSLRDEGWNDRLSSIRVGRDYWGSRNDDRDDDRDRWDRDNDRSDRGRGLNRRDADRIIRAAYQEILRREPDTQGFNLYRDRMLREGWTEPQVREALRTSPEYRTRNQMTSQQAERIVAAAYRAVLHREPDSASRPWIDRVLRERWTQEQVEAELRRSPEYRSNRR